MTRRAAAINARIDNADRKQAAEWASWVRRNVASLSPEQLEEQVRAFISCAAYRARQSERRRNRRSRQ